MKNIRFLIFILLAFESCQKAITPILNNSGPQLVIEGAVSDTTGPYHVNITTTTDFYANNQYAAVPGAVVTITDVTRSITDLLTETSPGVYTTHTIVGTPGNTYAMQVTLNGKTYTASSTMPKPVALDSVTIDFSKSDNFRPTANYQDPAGIVNYYKYNFSVNGKPGKHVQAFNDDLSDGRYIRDNLDTDTGTVHHQDLVKVSLVGVTHDVWYFFKEAENVAYNNDQLAAPATPASNITGGCLGYFSAQTVSTKSVKVK